MTVLLFFGFVVLAYFAGRWLQGRAQPSQDSSYPSHPTDSYANPYAPRDYEGGGCRPESADSSDGNGGGDSGGDGGGDSGGGGSD
ncbi:hypothetical protein D0B54_16585 [Solimonas sp. K1W22B-7]|uniref:hypothetical protein n=1 Tax=Solimonas sp. K1W22B-7 TaxID=2303331 RepID=UPI000E32E5AA|nr:hypothetical protein [Solimonas sp. K1W22B-7]AXQ30191.1 hypothetical protein D0B54_16585 [Solimonas sp. K1W22B-7]